MIQSEKEEAVFICDSITNEEKGEEFHSHANLLLGKPNSLSSGSVAGLLCVRSSKTIIVIRLYPYLYPNHTLPSRA